MKVFISYATLDFQSFRIPEIVRFLESQIDFEKVYYYHRDCKDSIITYMEKSIQVSDKIIFMCSENSNHSLSVRQELEMVTLAHKSWVPVYRDLNDVTFILQTMKGIEFNDNNFQGFLEDLYFKLTGQQYQSYTSKKMKDIIPIYSASGEPLGTVLRKEIHKKPLWHKTTLIFVVHPNGKIIYIKRSDQSDIGKNKFDCIGGHLIKEDNKDFRKSAKRELSEELNIPQALINDKDLIQIGVENQFEVKINSPYFNYEKSTLYVFFISKELIIQENIIAHESFGEDRVQLLQYVDYLDNLVEKFNQDSDKFADGISRILPEKEVIIQINRLIKARQNS